MRPNMLSALVAGGLSLASSVASANGVNTVVLSGTVRDFCAPSISGQCVQNPNFEGDLTGLSGNAVQGQIESTLGADGRPVFKGPALPSFTTQADFDQWYRDVPGYNLSKPISLTLTETAPGSGTYLYWNGAFFPIDAELWGNQSRGNNFHFTLELHGYTSFQDSEDSFEFTGDDDLWVFIDRKLVIDLGGVHFPATGKVTGAELAALGLTAGTDYSLDIFFAERHTTLSNFNITTDFGISAVPLPAALWSLASALTAVLMLARRRGVSGM